MTKITKQEILKLCNIVNTNTEYLNHGGCGVFAYLLGSVLDKFENCSVKVKVTDFCGGRISNIEAAIPEDPTKMYNWMKNGISFNYIFLEAKLKYCKPFYIDSNGIYTHSGILDGAIPVKYIRDIVQSNSGWNGTFNRRQIPKIICQIKSFFDNNKKICKDLVIKQWQLN